MLERPTSLSSETTNSDAQIEDYLDNVCAPLIGELPYAARQELRREIGAHLRSLIAAYVETGTAPQDASTMALEKFGDPSFVAALWRPELRRARPVNWFHSQRQGIAATLAAGAVVAMILVTAFPKTAIRQDADAMPSNIVRITPGPEFSARHPFLHSAIVNRGIACQDCHRSDRNLSYQGAFVFISDRNGNLRITGGNAIHAVGPNKIRLSAPNGVLPIR